MESQRLDQFRVSCWAKLCVDGQSDFGGVAGKRFSCSYRLLPRTCVVKLYLAGKQPVNKISLVA